MVVGAGVLVAPASLRAAATLPHAMTPPPAAGGGACVIPTDTTSEVGRLWESVRLALLDARTAEGQSEIALFERTVSRDGKKVRDASGRTGTLPARRPFASRTQQEITTGGYVVDTPDESAYYAPDADILLSDSFLRTHCFSVEKGPKQSPQLVGLAFRPDRERPGIADIDGTFWVDPAVQGPVRLEFRYTGVPAAYRTARVGGELLFRRLEGGQWLLSGWEIRMPLGVVNSRRQLADGGAARTQRVFTIDELKSFGGTVKTYVDGARTFTVSPN